MNEFIAWSPGITLDQIEKQTIQMAFRFYRGNKTATANSLGIALRTLDNKLERYAEESKKEEEREIREREKRATFLKRQRGETVSTSLPGAEAGMHLESLAFSASEPTMPMPERKEVQEMLPGKTSSGGSHKGRRAV